MAVVDVKYVFAFEVTFAEVVDVSVTNLPIRTMLNGIEAVVPGPVNVVLNVVEA